jgi:hypothetical protein
MTGLLTLLTCSATLLGDLRIVHVEGRKSEKLKLKMNTTTSMDKDPVWRAKQVYLQEECARSFDEDFYLHLNNPHAIVYKDASNLAMLRPVNRADNYVHLTNPGYNTNNPNCWWVYLLVGDFKFLLSLLPYPLEFIGWERNNVPRSYNLNHLRRWTLNTDHTSTEISSCQMANLLDSTKEPSKKIHHHHQFHLHVKGLLPLVLPLL